MASSYHTPPGTPGNLSPRVSGLRHRQTMNESGHSNRHQGSSGRGGSGAAGVGRRSRGSYISGHETDFLMATILTPEDANAATDANEEDATNVVDDITTENVRRGSFSGRGALVGNMISPSNRRSAYSVVDVSQQAKLIADYLEELQPPSLAHDSIQKDSERVSTTYGALEQSESFHDEIPDNKMFETMKLQRESSKPALQTQPASKHQASLLGQIPAITIISLLNLMMAIPFGVSYFPIGWSASGGTSPDVQGEDTDGVAGTFPLPGKEALGIRMCLFSTLVGQLVMTFASRFESCICFQMIENVPFFHTLASIVIAQQGYGFESLSTLFFLFGLSSAMVGIVFYLLGRLDLGRLVYFFPNHVLVGCIGGIGVFIIISAIEVTNDQSFSWDMEGLYGVISKIHLFGVVILFEVTLRILTWKTKSRIPLLAPIYFCSIPIVFYSALFLFRIDMDTATEYGYFFPSPSDSDDTTSSVLSRAFSAGTFDLLHIVDFRTISWAAVYHSFGTMVALSAFSLIHVPINIPAFSISMDLETDMNAELIAHGYSNFAAGIFGGLPNYMTYSNSLLYAKSNGGGRMGSLLVVFFTFLLFIFGPEIAVFIPRCMAGTLLLHVGLDLFLEGVVDSYGNYDKLEYSGIWLITLVMSAFGMTAALIAGVFAALSVFAAQSIQFMAPIRILISATNLRSSVWTRPAAELAILNDDRDGRSKILIVQLQGHLFFGNVNQLTETLESTLSERQGTDFEPLIVIMDFTLVLGLDSSAAHAVAKMNTTMHRRYRVAATVFVAGREGFPCEFALSDALSKQATNEPETDHLEDLAESLASIGHNGFKRNRICDNLDEALIFAEDVLIARQDPSLLSRELSNTEPTGYLTQEDERRLATRQLANLFPQSDEVTSAVKLLFSFFSREEYTTNQLIWKQGSESDSAKLLVFGECIAFTDSGANTSIAAERVPVGNLVGELGLVHGLHRLSTLECVSEKAVFYSLSRSSWEKIRKDHPFAAVYFEEIVIRYLTQRVQHVTNRIFESRCLPV